MSPLRIHGLVFSLLALLAAAAAVLLPRMSPREELLVFAVLVAVLGVPHGALDPIFARQLYGIGSPRGWIAFAVCYVALGAMVAGLWWLAPGVLLMLFLAASAAHFSGDLAPGTPLVFRIFYGGAAIVFPVLLHAVEVSQLFAFLAGENAANMLVAGLRWLAWPWLLGTAACLLLTLKRDWLTGLEVASVSLLAIAVTPLLAFTVFFCGMHSARHALRTRHYAGLSVQRLLLVSAAPMAAVLAGSALAWHFLKASPLDMRVTQIVFIGLAALTAPHMVLVERVRFADWLKAPAP